MTLMKWSPIGNIISIQEKMNKIFDDNISSSGVDFDPQVDIIESQSAITIIIDLPGISEEDINVHVTDGVLSISGERKFEDDGNKDNYFKLERFYGKFCRSFALPNSVDTANVIASLKDGVLKITLNKREDKNTKTVQVVRER